MFSSSVLACPPTQAPDMRAASPLAYTPVAGRPCGLMGHLRPHCLAQHGWSSVVSLRFPRLQSSRAAAVFRSDCEQSRGGGRTRESLGAAQPQHGRWDSQPAKIWAASQNIYNSGHATPQRWQLFPPQPTSRPQPPREGVDQHSPPPPRQTLPPPDSRPARSSAQEKENEVQQQQQQKSLGDQHRAQGEQRRGAPRGSPAGQTAPSHCSTHAEPFVSSGFFEPDKSFEQLGLHPFVVSALLGANLTRPSRVQVHEIVPYPRQRVSSHVLHIP